MLSLVFTFGLFTEKEEMEGTGDGTQWDFLSDKKTWCGTQEGITVPHQVCVPYSAISTVHIRNTPCQS